MLNLHKYTLNKCVTKSSLNKLFDLPIASKKNLLL